nr:replication associated protein [Lake Sarah-associated circular virus-21]
MDVQQQIKTQSIEMANGITTAFWGMVINNPDDNDFVLIHNGHPDHCRELIHTLEKGENGTIHIQAWLKLQRQQRLSFVKKLFPRANFKPLTSDEYIRNAKSYAQKLDKTAQSPSIHVFQDPMITLESVMRKLVEYVVEDTAQKDYMDERCPAQCWDRYKLHGDTIMRSMVVDDFRIAKVFVSDVFKKIWKDYGREVFVSIHNAHTHTHTQREDDENNVAVVDIPTTNADDDTRSGQGSRILEGEHDDGTEQEDSEDYDECETEGSEGSSESGDSQSDEEND